MKQWFLIGAVALASCATTSSNSTKRRVVTVNTPPPVQASTVRYDGPEAMAACDTRQMRRAALDEDPNNDTASITVEREVRPGVRTLTDLDINCREYFAMKLGGSEPAAQPTLRPVQPEPVIVQAVTPAQTAPAPAPVRIPAPQPVQVSPASSSSAFYRVRSGDTLYSIGRAHCTNWEAIAAENGIGDARRIEIGQMLRLPAGSC